MFLGAFVRRRFWRRPKRPIKSTVASSSSSSSLNQQQQQQQQQKSKAIPAPPNVSVSILAPILTLVYVRFLKYQNLLDHNTTQQYKMPNVDRVLRLLELTAHDVLLDIGCGEGDVVIAAARQFGCRYIFSEFEICNNAENLQCVWS